MDIATIIGIFFGGFVIIWAIVMGGSPMIFFDVPSLCITIGGMLCATLIHFSLPQFLSIFSVVKKTIVVKIPSSGSTIQQMVNYAAINRRDGTLALEQELGKITNPFFARGIQMLIDGQTSENIREIMGMEIQYLQERHSTGKKILEFLS